MSDVPTVPAIDQGARSRTDRRDLIRIRLSLAALALVIVAPLAAQAPTRVTGSNSSLWLQYYGSYHFASRWAVLAGFQLRRANFASEAEQTWLQLGLGYDATQGGGVTVGAGYIYLHTYPYGVFPAATDFPENRIWENLVVNMKLGLVEWQQRFQLEQRWIAASPPPPTGGQDWVFSWRARSLSRATIPFRKRPICPGDLYAALQDEIFIAFGSNVASLFNQNRAYALLGWQASGGFRVEGGYLNQVVARGSTGNETEIDHVLVLTLYHTASLR